MGPIRCWRSHTSFYSLPQPVLAAARTSQRGDRSIPFCLRLDIWRWRSTFFFHSTVFNDQDNLRPKNSASSLVVPGNLNNSELFVIAISIRSVYGCSVRDGRSSCSWLPNAARARMGRSVTVVVVALADRIFSPLPVAIVSR